MSVARLLQYASTAFGLVAIGRHLWRRRERLRTGGGTGGRLGPVLRWSVVTVLVVTPVLGGVVNAREDFHAYRSVTDVDYTHPTTVDLGGGASEPRTPPGRSRPRGAPSPRAY
ncbi:hypothetical protein [Streptomyces sp. URMC 123]|uniref:hypothetical protein n=1 Tax=Streptomyces sp. URMC 123 TaxID=3423403 RepID=UPI003F197D89